MPSKYSTNRKNALKKQEGLCYYCGRPMWQKKQKQFAKKHSISVKESNDLQCTAEHLIARCDGGNNKQENIVAACLYCNQQRHQRKNPLNLSQYQDHVTTRIKKGRWFSQRLAL